LTKLETQAAFEKFRRIAYQERNDELQAELTRAIATAQAGVREAIFFQEAYDVAISSRNLALHQVEEYSRWLARQGYIPQAKGQRFFHEEMLLKWRGKIAGLNV
jgi:thermostable 8-oxoguanine DNA glycosylase